MEWSQYLLGLGAAWLIVKVAGLFHAHESNRLWAERQKRLDEIERLEREIEDRQRHMMVRRVLFGPVSKN